MIAYLCPRHSSSYTLCRERGQTRERSRILIYADHLRTAVPFRFVFDAHIILLEEHNITGDRC
jgi:hypothetical protein